MYSFGHCSTSRECEIVLNRKSSGQHCTYRTNIIRFTLRHDCTFVTDAFVQCGDGSLVHRYQWCDEQPDCVDNHADELNCEQKCFTYDTQEPAQFSFDRLLFIIVIHQSDHAKYTTEVLIVCFFFPPLLFSDWDLLLSSDQTVPVLLRLSL